MRSQHKITQVDFDQKWISAGELCQSLSITTATLCLAIKRGTFPAPDVRIRGGVGLWERASAAEPIAKWEAQLGRIRNMRSQTLILSNSPPWKADETSYQAVSS
jgi:hypothetical protein